MSIMIPDNSSRHSIMKSADLGPSVSKEKTNQNENLLAIENDPQPGGAGSCSSSRYGDCEQRCRAAWDFDSYETGSDTLRGCRSAKYPAG
jgi:hypothetical protein